MFCIFVTSNPRKTYIFKLSYIFDNLVPRALRVQVNRSTNCIALHCSEPGYNHHNIQHAEWLGQESIATLILEQMMLVTLKGSRSTRLSIVPGCRTPTAH
eukprot:2203578-Amphidinium_carterae.1